MAVDRSKDTHALVQFLEEDAATAIIPVTRLKEQDNLEYGGSCIVIWSNRKEYKALLICSGSNEACAQQQDEIDGSDEEPSESPKRPRKAVSKNVGPSKKRKKSEKTVKETKSGRGSKKDKAKDEKQDNFVIHIGAAPPAKPKNVSPEKNSSNADKQINMKEKGNCVNCEGNHSEDSHSETESDADDDERPADTTMVNSNHDSSNCKHSEQQKMMEKVDKLKGTIIQLQKEQNTWLKESMQAIDDRLKLILATGVAKSLTPFVSQPSVTQMISSNVTPTALIPTVITKITPIAPVSVPVSVTPTPATQISNVTPTAPVSVQVSVTPTRISNVIPTAPVSVPVSVTPTPVTQIGNVTPTAPVNAALSVPVTPTVITNITATSPVSLPVSVTCTPTRISNVTPTALVSIPVTPTVITNITATAPVSAPVTPTGSSDITATAPALVPVTSTGTISATETALVDITNSSAIGSELTVTTEELLPQEVLFSLFRRSKSRWNLAALLSANLFDEETRLKSNVRGRGKDKLDPDIIQYIKAKCFMYHPSAGNPTAEWERCIKSIDVKSRAIKRKRKELPEQL